MIILNHDDIVLLKSDNISFKVSDNLFSFATTEVTKIFMITTDKGPFEDDIALAIYFQNNTFLIPSEHPLYENFLFEDLAKHYKLNYENITQACTSTDNAEFVIYEK